MVCVGECVERVERRKGRQRCKGKEREDAWKKNIERSKRNREGERHTHKQRQAEGRRECVREQNRNKHTDDEHRGR